MAALSKLHNVISALETAHPDAVFIAAGDFNQCDQRTVFPKYYQHVDIPTRDKNTPDHVYSNIRGAYRAAPRPHSDHISVFLYLAYRQRLKQTNPVTKQIKLWTPETESTLQDYRTTTSNISSTDSLPDDLNTFYIRFETSSHNTERRHTHT